MTGCKYIINLYTKKKGLIDNNSGNNKYDFIHSNLDKQNTDVIYLYKFKDGERYLSIRGKKCFIIQPANTPYLEMLWFFYGQPKNKIETYDSIINSFNKILDKNKKIKGSIEKDQIKKILTDLDTPQNNNKIWSATEKFIKNIENKGSNQYDIKYNQRGGIALWLIERGFKKYLPKFASRFFSGVLEAIDIVLLIASSIPGLHAMGGAGFVIDVVAIIYSFLRFDIIGIVGGIVSLIPVVGDIAGGIIKTGGKVAKYFSKATKYMTYKDQVNDKIRKVAKESKYIKFSDDFAKTVELGSKYGDDIIEGVRFGSKYGYEAVKTLEYICKTGDSSKLQVKYGAEGVSIAYNIAKYGYALVKSALYGAKYDDEAVISAKLGAKYGEEAIEGAESATRIALDSVDIIEDVDDELYERSKELEKRRQDEQGEPVYFSYPQYKQEYRRKYLYPPKSAYKKYLE